MSDDFLTPIAREMAALLSPVRLAVSSAEELQLLLERYGWDVQVNGGDMNAINVAFAVEPLIETVLTHLDELVNGTDTERLHAAADLLIAVKAMGEHLCSLAPSTGGLASPFDQGAFWSELAGLLLDDLIVLYFERRAPFLFALLHVFGVIRFEPQTPSGPGRIPFVRSRIDWAGLGDMVGRPGDALNDLYKWNKPGEDFDHVALLRVIERSLLAFRLAVSVSPPRATLASAYLDSASIVPLGINELEAPFVDGVYAGDRSYWKIGAVLLPIPDPVGTAGKPKGLLLSPLLQGALSVTTYFTRDIGMTLTGAFDADNAIVAKIYPGKASVEAGPSATEISGAVQLFGKPSTPWIIIGSPEASRLELDGFRVELGLRGAIGDPEIYGVFGTGDTDSKLRLHVELGDGTSDGFINKIAGNQGFEVDVGANLLWSSKHGVTFEGSAALEFSKDVHLALGPISIEKVYVAARADANGMHTDLGVGLKGTLGPVVAVVDNIGLRVMLVPVPNGGGAFGNLDLQFGFKPPNGVGLSVDAGVIKGGGYLYFDYDKEEYAGALELVFSGYLNLKAVGLITTRMPDGSKGFSLLVIITAEFGTGLQLGWGFTLLGVGGLLGLNRAMLLQPLVDGVRTGAVNDIMFPQDVVANAPRIISDLRAIFPPEEGKFLVGPMAKLGWGTPALISLSLGIVIEIPGDIAILGVLRAALPTSDQAILLLQVSFVGAIEFDKKRGYFFATLFESRVLFITLDGDMGVLAAFGEDANFVVSVGGFHPRFTPPPLPFPTPTRISVNILNESSARIRVMGYFAVTTNTAQFGAHAELYFGYDAFNVEGDIGFDALFQFSPFYFIIQIGAHVSLQAFGVGVFGIRLDFSLEGPTPWRAKGSGSISLLFFDISADFDVTWGEQRDTSLPPVAVMPLLVAEFDKLENWNARVPASNNLLVSLRQIEATPDVLVLHPLGSLRVSQRSVPLDLTLDTVGAQKPQDANRFSLAVSGGGLHKQDDATEAFALAQFEKMSDDDKLSRPAYEELHGGAELAADAGLAAAKMVKRVVRYEEIIIDTAYRRFARKFVVLAIGLFTHFLKGNSAARSGLSQSRKNALDPIGERIEIVGDSYVVASTTDNSAYNAQAIFSSEAMARDYLRQQIRTNANLSERLHVIPAAEMKQAA